MIVRDIQTERKTNIVTLVDKLVIKAESRKIKQKIIWEGQRNTNRRQKKRTSSNLFCKDIINDKAKFIEIALE